jgi:hypothetical protein
MVVGMAKFRSPLGWSGDYRFTGRTGEVLIPSKNKNWRSFVFT